MRAPWRSTPSRGLTRASCFSIRNCVPPKLRAARRLAQKKLGFRTLFDVVPLDAAVVRGSHGLPAADPLDRAILIGQGPEPGAEVAMTAVRDLVLAALGV